MPYDNRPVYSTASLRDAHSVRALLAAEGISAVVVRDPFNPAASAGTAHVTIEVAAADETAARRVVSRLERSRLSGARQGGILDAWPRCPECDAPRITCCPVCQTAGHEFPAADPEFSVLPDPGDAEEPLACGCGGAAGQPGETAPRTGAGSDSLQDDARQPDAITMLTCTTCDEPFVPRYLKRCEWCGHTFPDGLEFELPDDPAEPLNARVTFVFLALAAGALAVLAWLAYAL